MYSFVDASMLDEENSIQDVARRGFKIGPRGMKFILGNFRCGVVGGLINRVLDIADLACPNTKLEGYR